MKFFKKIRKWNTLIKFIIKCRQKDKSLGKFKILTTSAGLYGGIRIIIIELDSDDKMGEQIELTSD